MSAPLTGERPDTRPLTAPVDRAALSAYTRAAAAAAPPRPVPLTPFLLGVLGVVAIVAVATVLPLPRAQEDGTAWSAWLPPALAATAVGLLVVLVALLRRRARIRAYRLHEFAAANAMTYVPRTDEPSYPGMVFGLGHTRRAEDQLRGTRPRFVEFGDHRYTTGSGKSARNHHWGYVAIRLDVPLPHIVLDATSNDGPFGSSLPARFSKDQRLSLEGGFDRSFSLFCPAGYERDALYLFPPDIMARFLDHATRFDVEIVDDWMFLYAKDQRISTLDPARWAALFDTVTAILTKLEQWGRWRDERAATPLPSALVSAVPLGSVLRPGVAASGRRLRRTGSWIGVAAVAGAGIAWLLFRIVLGT